MAEAKPIFRIGNSAGRQRTMWKSTFPKRNLGYQVGAAGSGYCPVTASSYDGDHAAGCVTD